MSILFPTNDPDRLATAEDVLRVSSLELSTSAVSVPDRDVSELRDAYYGLQNELRSEAMRKHKLDRMRVVAKQKMPYLRQQVRGFWSAARSYIDTLVDEQAMLRIPLDSSNQSSKPGDMDQPVEEVVSDAPVVTEQILDWYRIPKGATNRFKDTQWVAFAKHLVQAIAGAPEARIPVFQTTTPAQLLMALDGLEEAVLFIANDTASRTERNLNSRKVRDRLYRALNTIALIIRFQCRHESREVIRQKQREFGFRVRLVSSSSSETQASEDSSSDVNDSVQDGVEDAPPVIQPEPNLEAEGTLG